MNYASRLSRLFPPLLQPEVVGPDWGTESDAVPFLAAELRRGPLALVELLRGKPLPENHNLLILVDQFEELFRMEGTPDQDEANKFVDLLKKVAEASHPREPPFYLVLTMRSDFLGDCALFRGLPEAINKSLYLTPRLTREQMEAAIVGPARVCGGDVDPLLLNPLLNEVTPDPDQLPVLQHALMRMWRKMLDSPPENGPADREARTLRPIHYQEIGETPGPSLDNHAPEVFEKHLSPTQQPVAQMPHWSSRSSTSKPISACLPSRSIRAAPNKVAGVQNPPGCSAGISCARHTPASPSMRAVEA